MHVSVSDLVAFQRYRDREEISLADLMRQLRREEPPNEKMLAGKALHKILETAQLGELDCVESCGHVFTFALDAELSLAPMREVRGVKDYTLNGIAVRLSGRADSIRGEEGFDHKLTKQFDAERYHDSYQWRAYMAIFGLKRFTYNVFVGSAKEIAVTEPHGSGIYVGPSREWTIRDFHQITFYHYPELDSDMRRELSDYAAFAVVNLPEAA